MRERRVFVVIAGGEAQQAGLAWRLVPKTLVDPCRTLSAWRGGTSDVSLPRSAPRPPSHFGARHSDSAVNALHHLEKAGVTVRLPPP